MTISTKSLKFSTEMMKLSSITIKISNKRTKTFPGKMKFYQEHDNLDQDARSFTKRAILLIRTKNLYNSSTKYFLYFEGLRQYGCQ